MPDSSSSRVTQLLDQISSDDPHAAAELLPLVYEELRELARCRMHREGPATTLQPTALVHEAYLRLIGSAETGWRSRGHFFGAAAEAMRRILVDRARKRRSLKRGGGRRRLDLDKLDLAGHDAPEELLALHEAIDQLETNSPTQASVVKLRFFAGLTIDQTADSLGLSTATVERYWAFARVWLYEAISKTLERAGPGG